MTKKQRIAELDAKVKDLEARLVTLETYRYPWWSIIPPEPIFWTGSGTAPPPDLGKSWCESIVSVSGDHREASCPY